MVATNGNCINENSELINENNSENNNEHIYEIYNGIVDLLTTCNPNDIDAIDELNDINNRFNIKNDNNINYTLQAIIEDFLFNDKYKKLRLEFC